MERVTIFLVGGRGLRSGLCAHLRALFPCLSVAGFCSPPFREPSPDEDQEIIDKINDARPDLIWVDLGAPKQEKWMSAHRDRLKAKFMIGVGAAFDFHSGSVPWTPGLIRAVGLEWLFRLICEPCRLWRRNLDSPLFLIKVLQQRLRGGALAASWFRNGTPV